MDLTKQDIATIRMLLEGLEHRIDGKLEGMEQRFDEKLEGLEQRFDGKLEGMGQRFDGKLNVMDQRINDKLLAQDERWEARMDDKLYDLKLEIFAKIDEASQRTLLECELEHQLC